jgi:hypothetical protein
MKKTVLLSLAIGCCLFTVLKAQQKVTSKPKSTAKAEPAALPADSAAKKPKPPVIVTLGHSDLTHGIIPKATFDSLMKEGLFARDTTGAEGVVYDFVFMYKERNLFEDSVGNYFEAFDLLSTYCKGNKLTRVIDNEDNPFDARSKRGDTVIFDKIGVSFPDGSRTGKPMKFVLGK